MGFQTNFQKSKNLISLKKQMKSIKEDGKVPNFNKNLCKNWWKVLTQEYD